MFGIISAWREHIRTMDELRDKATSILMRSLDMLILEFNRTAEGAKCCEDTTPEKNRETHIFMVKLILDTMNTIKGGDKHVYEVLKWRYEDELKECRELVES